MGSLINPGSAALPDWALKLLLIQNLESRIIGLELTSGEMAAATQSHNCYRGDRERLRPLV